MVELAVAALVVGLGALAATPLLAARALVGTPNAGRAQTCEEQAPEGVSWELWVPVDHPRAEIHAWVFEPDAAPAGTVLLLHGIEGRGSMMAAAARSYALAGYRAVAVDLRGHGCSTGEWATYGVGDARDLSAVMDALPESGPIGVHGISYGGGAALQLAALDPRVEAVVTVATFSSLRELAADHARRRAGLAWPLLPEAVVGATVEAAGQLAGFDPDQATSAAALARSHAPVLVVHGTNDQIVPLRHAFALADAAPERTSLLILQGQDHDSIGLDADGSVDRAATAWFDRWLGGREAPHRPTYAAVEAAAPQG